MSGDMDPTEPNGPRAALGEIYRLALFARTMTLTAQGKPLHEDHAHTASEPTVEKTTDQIQKAEVFLSLLIEKLDAFAKSFGLPDGWWMDEPIKKARDLEGG